MKLNLRKFFALCFIVASDVNAQLNVFVTGVGSSKLPIAIAHFTNEANLLQQVSAIIRWDLQRSGKFTNIDVDSRPMSKINSLNLGAWKVKGAAAFVSGNVDYMPNGLYEVRFQLYDTIKQQKLGSLVLISSESGLRMSAHKAADYIYQKLLGSRSAFATRLSYVIKVGNRYQLQIADSDGQEAHLILSSSEPIISPTWSPDGTKVAYVSFEKKRPLVYIHELSTAHRFIVSNQKGNNSAPAWSPDGRVLAVALSCTGNTQIFAINSDGTGLRRLTQSNAIDTEPTYSQDGRWIYFTSDRGGQPQIYRMPAQGENHLGAARRITFTGNYNASPAVSPDGKQLAYISRIGSAFKLYLQNLNSGIATRLTDTTRDESPSFAANGQYILYATQKNDRDVLATVLLTDGSIQQVLSPQIGSVREPSWGPFIQ